MKTTCALVAAAALVGLPACTTYNHQHYVGADSYALATRTGPGDLRETFHLDVRGSTGDASLRIVSDYERERPFLGLQLLELDGQAAAHRGVTAFSGLLVQGVYPQSAAAEAGVLAGDVLLQLDGQPVAYLAQAASLEAALRIGESVPARLLRGQTPLDLELQARPLRERVHDSQDIELERAFVPTRPTLGAGLRGIPAVWCERIYGRPCNAVVVTSVEVGSPAWLAGIRGGDVIETVDGAPVPPVAELSHRLREQGPGSQTQWQVRRGDMVYETSITLEDYSGERQVWIPLVFRLEDGVYSDRWTLGPFGLLAGNRSHYVADTSTRAVQTSSVFHLLFGLLRVESAPQSTSVRLLWLIRFAA
ncbi:MAG: PDZ domain-containing protein [Planctomycetes bacterium]|nr:PDZ domain-containing protein [Planctomycetota bacterium]